MLCLYLCSINSLYNSLYFFNSPFRPSLIVHLFHQILHPLMLHHCHAFQYKMAAKSKVHFLKASVAKTHILCSERRAILPFKWRRWSVCSYRYLVMDRGSICREYFSYPIDGRLHVSILVSASQPEGDVFKLFRV